MFEVKLMLNKSPAEKIGKDLEEGQALTVNLKHTCSILNPILMLNDNNADIFTYNYMYIPHFERYYFIDDIQSVSNGIWQISGHVDVLETYKEQILMNSAIIEGSEEIKINKYIYDPNVFIANCKTKTSILNFPSGLSENGEFILITAGG